MPDPTLTLDLQTGVCAVCRLDAAAEIPAWALASAPFLALTRSPEELSIVCAEGDVPAGIPSVGGWRMLKVRGPLAFSLTGVLAALAAPLAQAGVSIFAISTYDTDYLLVPNEQLEIALGALRAAGHAVQGD